MNHLLGRGFTWNVKPYFSLKNKNKRTMAVLNAHLCWKVGHGHSMSTTLINLEDITPIYACRPHLQIQLKLMELCTHKFNYMCLELSRDVALSFRLCRFPNFFEFIQDFIHVHLICKFQDDLIKIEWVMLMIVSNIDFFNNQGDVTQRQMIWSGQASNLFEILSMSTLPAF